MPYNHEIQEKLRRAVIEFDEDLETITQIFEEHPDEIDMNDSSLLARAIHQLRPNTLKLLIKNGIKIDDRKEEITEIFLERQRGDGLIVQQPYYRGNTNTLGSVYEVGNPHDPDEGKYMGPLYGWPFRDEDREKERQSIKDANVKGPIIDVLLLNGSNPEQLSEHRRGKDWFFNRRNVLHTDLIEKELAKTTQTATDLSLGTELPEAAIREILQFKFNRTFNFGERNQCSITIPEQSLNLAITQGFREASKIKEEESSKLEAKIEDFKRLVQSLGLDSNSESKLFEEYRGSLLAASKPNMKPADVKKVTDEKLGKSKSSDTDTCPNPSTNSPVSRRADGAPEERKSCML